MRYNRIIVWFRNDLRLSDNETLIKAIQAGKEVVPVYCFDPRMWAKTPMGWAKTGAKKTKFLIDSVKSLKESLQRVGADLILLEGEPEVEVVKLAEAVDARAVFFSQEATSEEKNVDKTLEAAAFAKGIATESFWQSTLYHLSDLPFPVSQTPEVFTNFRKNVEKMANIRPAWPAPQHIQYPSEVGAYSLEQLPTLQSYGLREPDSDAKSWLVVEGGEQSGLGRLRSYFWQKDLLKIYKETRNGLIGMDYSSKFSPWLSTGCISPRFIYEEVKRYEKERKKNDSTYWMIFELLWRDYFRFIAKKHGDKIFNIQGIKSQEDSWSRDKSQFEAWAEGRTGVPFVDANMRELNATGFMSNRGRQIVASFLVNDLGIDWTWGASYFESRLVDYDVCSNWGNWMYVGGVGNDPRENRYFNILRQAQNYDKKGDYARLWIPELQAIKGFDIHQPWELSTAEARKFKVQLGNTYPQSIQKIPALV